MTPATGTPQPGLCGGCAHVRVIRNRRDATFYLCERALADGWQELRIDTVTAPAFAKSARVSVTQSIEGAGEYIGYWDDLYLRPASGQ